MVLRTYLVYNTNRYYDRKKKVIVKKKKVLVICLAGARSLLRPEKKEVLVVCLAGARSLLRPEKKSSSGDFYAKLNVSNLNETNLY